MEQLTHQMPKALARSADQGALEMTRSPHTLTRREREILLLLCHRQTDAEIADRLCISRRTASGHVGRILEKLAVHNRREAGAVAWDIVAQEFTPATSGRVGATGSR